jgi:integrase
VSPAPLRERIGAAQTHLMAHVCKAHAEAMQGWAKALGHVIQPLVLPAQSAKDEKTLKQPDDVDELRLGSTYCVRRSVLRRLLWAAFTEMAGIDARHAEVDERRRAWADAQTYLCVLLAGICLGTRVSEVAQLRATAVDLQYTPPLLTLLGKGNRFAEESRTLMIPSRLVPLWRAVVPAGAPTPHTPAFTLHKQGRDDGRPLKREDVWRHVMASSARAGLRGDASDGVIRFHALRHHLVSFFLAQGVGWAHDAYWTGHQTAGAELLHPATPGALQAMWAEIAPALDTLLDELGITEAIVAAVVTRDGPVLAALANALKPTDLKIDDEAEVNDGDVAGPYETDTSVGATSRRSSTHGRGIPNTRTVNHSDTHNDDILSDEAGGATAALADPTPSESVR